MPSLSGEQIETFKNIDELGDAELRERFMDAALQASGNVGASFWLDEIRRRESRRQSQTMLRLTWVIGALTLVNAILVAATVL